MRIAIAYILFIAIIVVGCTTIDKLEPNQTETFLKFYSETNEMESRDLIVLDDGYLILSTYSESSTLLLKTDVSGNKLWAQSFDNFQGSSLTEVDDGYILIGDGINDQSDSTYMQLIKTNKTDGQITTTTQVGYGAQHGSAVMLTSTNEIIGLGYTSSGQLNDDDDTTYVIVTGFDLNLIQTWNSVRSNPVLDVDIIPSNSIYEANDGRLTWISYSSEDEINTNLNFTAIYSDNSSPDFNTRLFNNYAVSNFIGDFVKTPVGFAVLQTVDDNGLNNIGITTSVNGVLSDDASISLGGNSIASSITNSNNGLLIAASHIESGQTDADLVLFEVEYNGQIRANGIDVSYGGDGDELPIRIRRTNDGGYIILGTLINTKGARQSFILKTNNKGALN